MKKYKIKYQVLNKTEEKIVETIDLSKEELPKNIIEINEYKDKFKINFKKRLSDKKLSLLFYELNLMLQSNINISDTLDILLKNKKEKDVLEFLKTIKYCLSNSKSIKENLKNFRINNLVITFLEISQNNGNLALNIKALNELLKENIEIKKNFFKSLSYPLILMVSFCISLFAIFNFVIPKFKMIFSQSKTQLPLPTQVLLQVDYFFENYFFYFLIIVILLIAFIIYLYKSNENFLYFMDEALAKKIFLFRDIYLSKELYKLFLIIDIMLKSNYEFHKAFISSKLLLKNKYLLDKIYIIDNLLKNGKSIKDSFLKTEIFDDIVLNLINTGEVSNSLDITIDEIKKIYKNKFYEKIDLLTSLIQPIFLVIIMGLILWIVLGIFMPIWDMGNMINL